MKMQAKLVSVVGAAVVACSLGVAVAQSKKEPVFVDPGKRSSRRSSRELRKRSCGVITIRGPMAPSRSSIQALPTRCIRIAVKCASSC